MALNLSCSIQKNLESDLSERDLSKLTALFKSILRFSTLVLWYFTLVGHTQSQVDHLKLVILKVHSRSY